MTFDITPIIEAVAALIAALIAAVVVPYIKSKTTAQQQAEINAWVKIAVAAAEQIYTAPGGGRRRKPTSWTGSGSTGSPWMKPSWTPSSRPQSTS